MSLPQPGQAATQLPAIARPWNQLRWWLIITFVSLVILPLALVVALTFNQVRSQTTQQVTDQLEAISDLKTAQILQWIDDSHAALRFMLSAPAIAQIEPILADATRSPEQLAAINRLLAQLLTSDGDTNNGIFTQLFIYDQTGRVLAASDPRQIGRIVQRQPYFSIGGSPLSRRRSSPRSIKRRSVGSSPRRFN